MNEDFVKEIHGDFDLVVTRKHYDDSNLRHRSSTNTCLVATALKEKFPGAYVSVGVTQGFVSPNGFGTFPTLYFDLDLNGEKLIKQYSHKTTSLFGVKDKELKKSFPRTIHVYERNVKYGNF